MSFGPGSLVRARGRDWIVQAGSTDDYLLLHPLGGRDEEATGLALDVEPVEEATFALPTADHLGDAARAGLLRDAARLSFRSAAGPFRSFGRIAVEPRPYQLVPLLMALKLDPVRLLIADDVGVGKTIEALLIARELLDRGEIRRFTVLTPPHLAEQWQRELRDGFHVDATLVLASTARSLDRDLGHAESIFDRHPFTVVSTDFIKTDARRQEFQRTAPELVIVDEAHTSADPGHGRKSQHQRHRLLAGLAADEARHLLLVTATPHSGNEDAFRSLLGLLDPAFRDLPDDLQGPDNEPVRRHVAKHFVQRKRGDVRAYLDAQTDFPDRDDADVPYALHPDAKALFHDVLAWARGELGRDEAAHRRRVRWWATLGLLRALASSPAAAASTLRNRAAPADTDTPAEADAVGRRTVFDEVEEESTEGVDVTPGGQVDGNDADAESRRTLRTFAERADALRGAKDAKLSTLVEQLRSLLDAGRAPIVFCRFIETAEYVADHLRTQLPGTEVTAVTGTLAPAEREARVLDLTEHERRTLVATDCLSEGINLQRGFDAVVHYDLSWNPTRHEQREGRVDRYGQARDTVAVRTLYGRDNQIDGVVLDVLIRKHKNIRNSLGISVPVPAQGDDVVDAIFEGLLLRDQTSTQEALFEDLEAYVRPKAAQLDDRWEAAADRERTSRTMFAQRRIHVGDVARELEAAQRATGGGTVRRFVERAVPLHGGHVAPTRTGASRLALRDLHRDLRESLPMPNDADALDVRYEAPVHPHESLLTRTHPVTEALASYVLDAALDPDHDPDAVAAARSGVMRTDAVRQRTTLLLVRLRYHLTTRKGRGDGARTWRTLAEETLPLAFSGAPDGDGPVAWWDDDATEALLDATPDANVAPDQARRQLERMLEHVPDLLKALETVAEGRAEALRDAHARVRDAARA
ncbi:MAG: helicase-related protein, partial [Trueperaceae bacterium]|nr:helicase-related protein [Trueperaceae bacterium]